METDGRVALCMYLFLEWCTFSKALISECLRHTSIRLSDIFHAEKATVCWFSSSLRSHSLKKKQKKTVNERQWNVCEMLFPTVIAHCTLTCYRMLLINDEDVIGTICHPAAVLQAIIRNTSHLGSEASLLLDIHLSGENICTWRPWA